MFRRWYHWLTTSTSKGWILLGSILGVGALPCPDCGAPMIFHIWPIAALVFAAQAIKQRYLGKNQIQPKAPSAIQPLFDALNRTTVYEMKRDNPFSPGCKPWHHLKP